MTEKEDRFKQIDIIAVMFNKFDVTLIEDELVSRGVGCYDASHLTTSNSAIFRDFLRARKWDFVAFYCAVEARSELKLQKKKEAKSTVCLLNVSGNSDTGSGGRVNCTCCAEKNKEGGCAR